MPKLARAFGGLVNLAKVPPEYGTGVGNIDKAYVAWMIHNYAVQQSRDITGRFRSYTVFGLAIGNATLMADPDNPVGGTVPKSTAEIGSTLVQSSFSCVIGEGSSENNPGCLYRIFKQGVDGHGLGTQHDNC